MNISNDILKHAKALNLKTISTGGGCDYIFIQKNVNGNPIDIILSGLDDAESPEDLFSPAELTFYFTDNWDAGFSMPFDTAGDALNAMASIFIFSTGER